jgi:hypothetical protein
VDGLSVQNCPLLSLEVGAVKNKIQQQPGSIPFSGKPPSMVAGSLNPSSVGPMMVTSKRTL